MQANAPRNVVTWQSPSGDRIRICPKCEERLTAEGTWPKDARGDQYCQVSRGLHWGICDTCEPDAVPAA
jgi:hypothetical protein